MSETILLTNGYIVEVRPVPPYVQAMVREALPSPKFPMITLKSEATGNEETMPAMPGTKEYNEYQTAVLDNRRLVSRAMTSFLIDYGVVRWRAAEGEWETDAPAGWSPPTYGILGTRGITDVNENNTLRSMYIRFELLTTDADTERVDRIIFSKEALTKEEILAALDPFSLDAEVDLWSLARRK